MQTILWRDLKSGGVERAVLAPDPAGYHLGGTALLPIDGAPIEIRYSVLADREWRTRVVGVHVQGPGINRRIALRADGAGRWTATGVEQPELAGALDVDLTFSPATATVPIRRLGLAVGGWGSVETVVIDPRDREVRRSTHTYARLDDTRYRHTSGDLTAELTVDASGFVVDHPGRFETLAGPGVGSPP